MADSRRKQRSLIGVIHLPALPGSPGSTATLDEIAEAATADGRMLLDEGFDGLIVENYGDAPFHPDRVPPVTIASMTRIAVALRSLGSFALGINVLRNDARAALAVAVASKADFIRVNVHTGVFATDQGLIEGRAHDTMRERAALGAARVRVWADVLCKHASPLGATTLEEHAKDLVERGGADQIILTGSRTGSPPTREELERLIDLKLGRGIIVGSGVTDANARDFDGADGVIVGSFLRDGGRAGAAIDVARVRSFARAWRGGG